MSLTAQWIWLRTDRLWVDRSEILECQANQGLLVGRQILIRRSFGTPSRLPLKGLINGRANPRVYRCPVAAQVGMPTENRTM
jgi:hypothetical protein